VHQSCATKSPGVTSH